MFKVISAVFYLLFWGGIIGCSSSGVEKEHEFFVDKEQMGELDSVAYFGNEFLYLPVDLTPDVQSVPEEKIRMSNLSEGICFSLVQRDKSAYEDLLASYHSGQKDVFYLALIEGIEKFQKRILMRNGSEVAVVIDTISKPGIPKEIRWKTYKVQEDNHFLLTIQCSENTFPTYQNEINYSIQQFHSQTKAD